MLNHDRPVFTKPSSLELIASYKFAKVSFIMSLPGNDVLVRGGHYVISIYGDDSKVFTHKGTDIYLQPYEPGDFTQIFLCTLDSDDRWGFVCVGTGVRMGRNRYENLKCESKGSDQGSWECFYFNDVEGGGYKMCMNVDEKLRPLYITSDGGGEYLSINKKTDGATIGLTRVHN
ncbi:hypothetical protein A0H81_10090 [Grifola frondosa]|uniref:Uncharacterized protein n=1 Tax=Grifola frondosa TaxID=5627 RepID=A0A1C7LY44_GRIFR|nr:hypothetical protein A0H81_10090 [Grifola frondosa]